MTQPKRTGSRLLSALLGLIMLLSLLPTVTLAAERVPEELKAITVTLLEGLFGIVLPPDAVTA